jgi:hypothetical protein
MQGGESVAKEVVIKGDTITITRDISVQGLAGSVVAAPREAAASPPQARPALRKGRR